MGGAPASRKHLCAADILAALQADPNGMAALAAELGAILFAPTHIQALVDAIEAVNATHARTAPGKLFAGTVTALQLNGSSVPIVAMVALHGAATAIPVYIPTHIRAAIATSQNVWVMAVNGNISDAIVFSIRNVF